MEVSFYLSKVFIVMSLLPFSLKQDFITQWNSMPTPPTPTSSPNHYMSGRREYFISWNA